jgi:D-alanine-D-alanine ligase
MTVDASGREPDRVRLIVLFGGRSAEHDVSCVTASHVMRAVDPERYDVQPIGITREGQWVLAEDAAHALAERGPQALPATIAPAGPDIEPTGALVARDAEANDDLPVVVFPLLHGPLGEDGTVQGLLEVLDVPYVGSGVLGSSLSMDKAAAKLMAAACGVAQPRWRAFREHERREHSAARLADELGLPCFVKPANLGSSVGITKAHDLGELEAAIALALEYDEWVVVEEAITGREIEVAVLGDEEPRASVPGEIVPSHEFYDYDDKYLDGEAGLLVPAPLDDAATAQVRALALDAFGALRCEGMARVDFFYETEGSQARGFLLNEINTIPGFTPISMYPKLWAASGVSYPELIDELVRLALARHARRRRNTKR